MKSSRLTGNGSIANKKDGGETLVDDHPSKKIGLGDIIWVKLRGSSWWPTQVVDNMSVSQRIKPGKRSAGDVLVRLYGSYNYRYVDPATCQSEFEKILKKNDGNWGGVLQKALEKELARLRSERAGEDEPELGGEGKSKVEENRTKPIKISPRRLFPGNTEDTKGERLPMMNKKSKPNQPDSGTTAGGNCQELSARRMKVMQNLGLIAPNGSPYHRKDFYT